MHTHAHFYQNDRDLAFLLWTLNRTKTCPWDAFAIEGICPLMDNILPSENTVLRSGTWRPSCPLSQRRSSQICSPCAHPSSSHTAPGPMLCSWLTAAISAPLLLFKVSSKDREHRMETRPPASSVTAPWPLIKTRLFESTGVQQLDRIWILSFFKAT